MSKYENIETPKELIREVISNGMSTVQEDINRAADIFGNHPVGEMAKLANSEETISGKCVGDMFYFIAFSVWNWREAVSFYNEHTLAVGIKFRDAERKLQQQVTANDELLADVKRGDERIAELDSNLNQHAADNLNLCIENEAMQKTIIELKAKLYDLITAGA